MESSSTGEGPVIFRRYRTLKNGRVLDAHDYGLKAWPIPIGKRRRREK